MVHAITAQAPFPLDRATVVQLLGDDQFYLKTPLFLFLREMGLASYSQFVAEYRTLSAASGCCNKDPHRHLRQPIQVFAETVIEAHSLLGPPGLEPLKNYLSSKLGYEVTAVRMYHKTANGEIVQLEF